MSHRVSLGVRSIELLALIALSAGAVPLGAAGSAAADPGPTAGAPGYSAPGQLPESHTTPADPAQDPILPDPAADCVLDCAGTDTPGTGGRTDVLSTGSASTGSGVFSVFGLPLKGVALTIVPLDQFGAFDAIISHESSWNPYAINPASGAYGLGQALPAWKMADHGWDWPINPITQLRWAYDYMNERYGSPDAAWVFWQAHNWY